MTRRRYLLGVRLFEHSPLEVYGYRTWIFARLDWLLAITAGNEVVQFVDTEART